MHGRLKVRTSAEEKERKNAERALKVKAYKAAITKINHKRELNEYDDELMQITSQILLRNPDIGFLWNIRRECILRKVEELKDDSAALVALYDAELGFTQNCLVANHKSYSSWHQRCWVLEHNKEANYEREVQLCNRYLKLDERNFHTWDYRRHVFEKAGFSPQQDFDFCTEKIKFNFSNYSSWHQRSLLLPKLFPNENQNQHAIAEDQLKQELDMVLTAAFTDPNDSSAWFYQRWLLDTTTKPKNEICAFRCDNNKAVLVFAKPLKLDETPNLKLNEDDAEVCTITNWQSQNNKNIDNVWFTEMPKINLSKSKKWNILYKEQKLPLEFFDDNNLYLFKPPNHGFCFASVVLNELKTQLKSCEDLLQYEPDNKWALLTTAFIMRTLDSRLYHNSSLAHLARVMKIDVLRQGYYKDLTSKWILEEKLKDWLSTHSATKANLVLTEEKELFSLPYKHYFNIMDKVELPGHLKDYKISVFSSFFE